MTDKQDNNPLSKENPYNWRGQICRIARYQHKWSHCTWREAIEYAKWRVNYNASHPIGIMV